MNNFKELIVWQKSVDLSVLIYNISDKFPAKELYLLTSQIRRCATSIPSNIAEGAGRNSGKDFHHFLSIAEGSAFELETQIIIANKLKIIDNNTFDEVSLIINEIQKMIRGLQKSLS